ncbi:MAG: acetyl-CoA hydrolase [Xanthomonadales bacterium]|nr:acetyl-CoA hydrolase [Xanthomonadales bacterium]
MRQINQIDEIPECVDRILEACGSHVVLAIPLGLGKPNHLVNALYRRIAAEPSRRLTIHTALSLAVPKPGNDIERRFAEPFLKRQFGEDYPDLDYVAAMRRDALPANIRVHEFYFQSGAMLHSGQAQRDYVSLNYTAVARDLVDAGINVIAQLVARRGQGEQVRYSLGCNPDVTLDLIDYMREAGLRTPLTIGVVNDDLPYLGGDADVGAGNELFDIVLCTKQRQPLFALPHGSVDDTEYAIGLHASTLVRDAGTLQIGIGALSDALVAALILRHERNDEYRQLIGSLGRNQEWSDLPDRVGGLAPFESGLHGSSEMVMDGFMHLRRHGILVRRVYQHLPVQEALDVGAIGETLRKGDARALRAFDVLPARLDTKSLYKLIEIGVLDRQTELRNGRLRLADGTELANDLDDEHVLDVLDRHIEGRPLLGGCYLQGGFCLGTHALYGWLSSLTGEDYAGLEMSRISEVNRLQLGHERLAVLQRRNARFFNTCMLATALGAAASDALEDGRVVSGVGGQYNFVALANALVDGRSILMLRSMRMVNGEPSSNIRWNYGHTTIPRPLRDIYVTEYGIADLRGKTDQECATAMISISDAQFHRQLVDAAIAARKLPADFVIPPAWATNTAAQLQARLKPARSNGLLPDYPFGSDFNGIELRLLAGLGWLKAATAKASAWHRIASALIAPGVKDREALDRMGLAEPKSVKQRLLARLLTGALNRA